jgi:hypothetical protein
LTLRAVGCLAAARPAACPGWTGRTKAHYSASDAPRAHRRFPHGVDAVSTILLLVIALVAPWTVHLAPPRQRPLALVGVVAVFLLYGIFAENPLLQWEMWAGLAAGILTVLFLSGSATGRGGRASGGSRSDRQRARLEDSGNHPTGEL